MREDYHIDLSIRLFDKGTTGIACVGAKTKAHCGCALSGSTKVLIRQNLFRWFEKRERAKLYAICIYYLVRDRLDLIERLVVCNDENFELVNTIYAIWLAAAYRRRI